MMCFGKSGTEGKILKTMLQKLLPFALVAVVLLTSAASFAQPQAKPNALLQKMEADGARIDFLGQAYGLDGWMVTDPKAGTQYMYTTAEGALVAGMLFAPDGRLETMRQLRAYKEKADAAAEKLPSKAEKFYAAVEKAHWVALGENTAPYLYVFVNVGCAHCLDFWKDIESGVRGGSLQVRLVPYGAQEVNRDGAAALLSAERPDEAWQAYARGDVTALGKDKIKDGFYAKVDENTALARDWKLPAPPFTLYRRPADGIVTAIAGRPENKMLLPAEMLNLGGKP